MTYLFLDHKTGALVQMLTPSPVHEALIAFAEAHKDSEYIARPKPEGNYILKVER